VRWPLTKRLERLQRPFIAAIAAAALLQWVLVLERSWAAVWAWFKFNGFGGGGHIDVGGATQALFLFGSTCMALAGYALAKAQEGEAGSRAWARIARLSWTSIILCTALWVLLLLSPLVEFRRT
jgi:hypothetical protein